MFVCVYQVNYMCMVLYYINVFIMDDKMDIIYAWIRKVSF